MRPRIIAGLSTLALVAGIGGAAASSAQASYQLLGTSTQAGQWVYATNNAQLTNFESPQRGGFNAQDVWFRGARGNGSSTISGTVSCSDHGNPYANIGDTGLLECHYTHHWQHNALSTDYLLLHTWISYTFNGYNVPAGSNETPQKYRTLNSYGTYARQGYNVPIGQPARDDGFAALGANFSNNPPW